MVTKVVITDNTNSPLHYLSNLDNFKNGKEYEFKDGVNVIVGENGCGKTTLLKLIKKCLLVDFTECSLGRYNSSIRDMFGIGDKIFDGVDVYADYHKNTFRLSHPGEKERYQALETFNDFGTFYGQSHSSTGEGILIALDSLFRTMFSKEATLEFDYEQDKLKDNFPEYVEYVKRNRMEGNSWTILMDEPDRNLSLDNLMQIKAILSFRKPQTQIIAVVHNPLLIVSLSKNPKVNIIEMTEGYVDKIKDTIKKVMQ